MFNHIAYSIIVYNCKTWKYPKYLSIVDYLYNGILCSSENEWTTHIGYNMDEF